MLNHPTLDLLHDLGLHGMAKSFRDMTDNPEGQALGHTEWLGILLDRESTLRQQKRFESRAKTAKLRHLAAVEDVDYRTPRGLDRTRELPAACARVNDCTAGPANGDNPLPRQPRRGLAVQRPTASD